MPLAFFTSDLHGRPGRYDALIARAAAERPDALFLGGDLLPHGMDRSWHGEGGGDFVSEFLAPRLADLRNRPGLADLRVLLILGNDDPQVAEAGLLAGQDAGLWEYIHGRRVAWAGCDVYGYNCVPPTPFLLKDWERYDVSRFVDPGCIPPDEGRRTDGLDPRDVRWTTIRAELDELAGAAEPGRTILLCHTPPYGTNLDRAALDGRMVDHAPVDVHVGSIALRDFIEAKQPLLSLHGHIHEAVRLTGAWREKLGATHAFGGAHDGHELALVRFDPAHLDAATRELVAV